MRALPIVIMFAILVLTGVANCHSAKVQPLETETDAQDTEGSSSILRISTERIHAVPSPARRDGR